MRKNFNLTDISSIANEAIFLSYRFNHLNIGRFFGEMSVMDYTAVWIMSKKHGEKKVYLTDIAAELNMPLATVTKLAKSLTAKGLVTWTHDGNGEDGTYLQITERGTNIAAKQQQKLKDFYETVIEKFGRDNFVEWLTATSELTDVMTKEIKKRGDENG